MPHNAVPIKERISLANQFWQITVDIEPGLPGQFVHLPNGEAHYLIAPQAIILPPHFLPLIENKSTIELSGLMGNPLEPPLKEDFTLLVADNTFNAACFYLKKYRAQFNGLVVIGSHDLFPFQACPSRMLIPGMPADIIAAVPLLEDWHIPHRLASLQEVPGCYLGTALELAECWNEQNTDIKGLKTLKIA